MARLCDNLDAFFDCELTEQQFDEFVPHLGTCPVCADGLEQRLQLAAFESSSAALEGPQSRLTTPVPASLPEGEIAGIVLDGLLHGAAATSVHDRQQATSAMGALANGEDEAFGDLWKLVAPRLWAYLRRRLPPSVAEDVLQQTLLRLYHLRGAYRPGTDVFPWLYQIAHTLSIDTIRRAHIDSESAGRSQASSFTGSASDPSVESSSDEHSMRLLEALAHLPERQRSAYELVMVVGMSETQAAAVLGTTRSATKALLHRAHQALIKALAGDESPRD